jgi:uncharacterized delta-60 repeat protein
MLRVWRVCSTLPGALMLLASACEGRSGDGALSLRVDAPAVDLVDAEPAAQKVHLVRGSGVGAVDIVVDGLPPGVSAKALQLPAGVTDGIVTLQASADAQQGSSKVFAHATAKGATTDASAEFEITVRGAPGTPDRSFGTGGVAKVPSSEAHALALDSNGRIVIAGDDSAQSVWLARFLATGDLDPDFHGGLPETFNVPDKVVANADSIANGIAVVAGDKIVVAGRARPYLTTHQNAALVARCNVDGSLDPTFGPDMTGYVVHPFANGNGSVAGVAVLANGDLALGGNSFLDAATECGAFVHLDSNGGLLDESASCPPTGRAMAYEAIAAAPDGTSVLVFGHADSSDGLPRFLIGRYPGGATGFDPAYANPSIAFTMGDMARAGAVFPDGSAVAAGFTAENGLSRIAVARVDASGNPLASFQGTGRTILDSGVAEGVAIDSKGRLVIASTGTAGPLFSTLSRLDGDTGQVDLGFGTNGVVTLGDPGAHVAAVAIDSHGRIVVAGTTSVSGNPAAFVERIWP